MPEIRIDPLSGQRTIVAAERALRPGGEPGCAPAPALDRERDPLADGHEQRTPPELYALRPAGGRADSPGWSVRVVPNLFPVLGASPPERAGDAGAWRMEAGGDAHAEGVRTAEPKHAGPVATMTSGRGEARLGLLDSLPAAGAHELIVNAPDPVGSLAELSASQVAVAMGVWRERMRAHAQSPYVQLIVNERREAGASLEHTHAQLYALGFVPAEVARERERFMAYASRTLGHNLLEELVAEEVRLRERIVALDDEAVLLAPYASRAPFQLMLVPRRARARFEDEGPLGAALLHDGLRRLAARLGASPPLNLWVRTAPAGAEHFCWRIDVVPRLTHLAGLELSTGLAVNIVAPERAAAQLREAG